MISDLDRALSAKSDQLCADDLYGGERTIKITEVKIILNQPQPIHIRFEDDDGKPWKPSKTQGRIMKAIWGKDEKDWIGKRVTVYREPTVKWSGQEVGGVFISKIEGITKRTKLVLAESKHKKAAIFVDPLDHEIEIEEVKLEAPQPDESTVLRAASDAARNGKDAFNAWWKSNPNLREIVKPIMEDLKLLVEESESNVEPS